MKVLIFGYGLHGGGFDSAMYFLSHGDEVRITDIRNREKLGESIDYLESKGAVIHCGGHMTDDFTWADVVIKNPTIRRENEFLAFSKRTDNDLTYASTDPICQKVKMICVTGAHDKTTTASALCHALNHLGKTTHMCGNMGISAFSEMRKWENGDIPEYVIIELSTWQARDTYIFLKGQVPQVEVSVITSIFEKQEADSEANDTIRRTGEFNVHSNHIICPASIKDAVKNRAGKKTRSVSSIEGASRGMSKSLPAKMAPSFAVLRRLGFNSSQANEALKSFKGIPNRSELVLRTATTMYINDSSSIIPAAVNFSMENLESLPVNLICGGSDSTLDASSMLKSLKTAASVHLLEGSFTRKRLIPLLKENGIDFNGPFEKMEDAFDSASSMVDHTSKALQVILLSPGASAFEYFGNEYLRGEIFSSIVRKANSSKKPRRK